MTPPLSLSGSLLPAPTRSWERRDLDLEDLLPEILDEYSAAGEIVAGLTVGSTVSNLSSIGASLVEWEEASGIRVVPMADFGDPGTFFYARNDLVRAAQLAEEIRASGRIDPLIVVIDAEGPYILEGAHRLVALHRLGATHLPAKVVIDIESFEEELGRDLLLA